MLKKDNRTSSINLVVHCLSYHRADVLPHSEDIRKNNAFIVYLFSYNSMLHSIYIFERIQNAKLVIDAGITLLT